VTEFSVADAMTPHTRSGVPVAASAADEVRAETENLRAHVFIFRGCRLLVITLFEATYAIDQKINLVVRSYPNERYCNELHSSRNALAFLQLASIRPMLRKLCNPV